MEKGKVKNWAQNLDWKGIIVTVHGSVQAQKVRNGKGW
jgi:hypothetical protein